MTPVWLLDIDGVLNAGPGGPDRSVWPAEAWRRATVHSFSLLVAEPLCEFIRQVHESGRAEIRWHTTWQETAQLVADEYHLPTLPIAVAPEYKTWSAAARGWWKRAAAERVLRDEDRPLVWTDDDIRWRLSRDDRDQIHALGPVLLVAPTETTGLTPRHLLHIGDFLDLHPAEPVPSEATS